jgi:hypothetical protein
MRAVIAILTKLNFIRQVREDFTGCHHSLPSLVERTACLTCGTKGGRVDSQYLY